MIHMNEEKTNADVLEEIKWLNQDILEIKEDIANLSLKLDDILSIIS
jgi:superfamily I DNA and RNA helicase